LSPVLVGQFGDGLELQNDLFMANEVWLVSGLKGAAFVFQRQRLLGDERHAPKG